MQWITALASALSPPEHDLAAERLEHVWQMNLIGDPLLHLNHPAPLDIQAPNRIAPGDNIRCTTTTPMAGRVTIELMHPRDRSPRDVFIAGKFTTDQTIRDKMQATYESANLRTLSKQHLEVSSAGTINFVLPTTTELTNGRYVLRVFIEGSQNCAAGACDVLVRVPRPSTPSP